MTEVTDAVAERLRAAVGSADLDGLAAVLREDVRWGGEGETPDTCHSRSDVLAWYGRARAAGFRARVVETILGDDAVLLGLHVTGREPGSPDVVYQVFRLVDGLVADIRGFPERDLALDILDTPLPG